MEILKTNTDDLNAVLTIKVKPQDYSSNVEQVLKDYRKSVKMPGFRPGHVPVGLVKKMYGKAIMADEINKIVHQSLNDYIKENKLNILGHPLPVEDDKPEFNFDKPEEFELKYDLGLSPGFEVNLSAKEKFPKYVIQIDDELIKKQTGDLRKRYGKVSEGEVSTDKDMLFGEFTELQKGEPKENGVTKSSTVSVEYLEDEKIKKQLTGLKLGDKLKVDPSKMSKGEADMAAMLGVKKSKLKDLSKEFEFVVTKIYKVEPCDFNQEFFDKIFGPEQVKSEAEFNAKVKEEMQKALTSESDKKLTIDIRDRLKEKLKLSLPGEFLKRWLISVNSENEKVDLAQIDDDFSDYAEGLKWQLIENKIIEENGIKVNHDEAIEYAAELVRRQFMSYGQDSFEEEELKKIASGILEKEEEGTKIYQQIYDQKINDLFKETFTFKEKEVSYDEFVNLVTGKSSKFNLFGNLFKK